MVGLHGGVAEEAIRLGVALFDVGVPFADLVADVAGLLFRALVAGCACQDMV